MSLHPVRRFHPTYRRVPQTHHRLRRQGRLAPGRRFASIFVASRNASIYNLGHANYKPQPAWQPAEALVRGEPTVITRGFADTPGSSRRLQCRG